MSGALYTIVGFGVALSAIFEGDKWYWALVAGVVWPLALGRIVYIRLFDP